MNVSVLIPVYNCNITTLIEQLVLQFKKTNVNFEILLIDDCSDLSISYINLKTNNLEGVKYKVLNQNIGRAAIRNLLFSEAEYEFCICIDCDMLIEENANFISNYINNYSENNIVVGGHYYQKEAPKNEYLLHWKYGTKIEVKTAIERQKNPYHSFMSGNFCCSKTTFQKLKFNQQIKGYGHEDTLFGIIAAEQKIIIKQIDNSLLHNGLNTATEFLAKQENAVKNLKYLYNQSIYSAKIKAYSSLVKIANNPFVYTLAKAFKNAIQQNLLSKNPNLLALQLQKIIWWHKY